VGEEPEAATVPQSEVAAEVPPQSPTPSQALLGAVVEAPSAEEWRRRKGKGIFAEEARASDDDVVEVQAGLFF